MATGIWAVSSFESGTGFAAPPPPVPRSPQVAAEIVKPQPPPPPGNQSSSALQPGFALTLPGLKARRDGQAGVLSLVSGQRGGCDRAPECV